MLRCLEEGVFARPLNLLRTAPMELWLVYALKVLDSYGYFALSEVFTLLLTDEFGVDDVTAGAYYGVWGTAITVYGVLTGFLIDAMGVRTSLVASYALQTVSRVVLTGTRSKPLALAMIFVVQPLASSWGAPVMTIAIKRLTSDADRTVSFGIFYAMMNVAALTSGFAIDGLRLGLPGGLGPKDPASVLASPIRVVVLSTVFSSVAALLVALRFRELPPVGGDCESNSDADTNGSDSDTAINTDTGLRPILRRSPAAAAAAAAAVSTTASSSPSTLPASPSSPPQITQHNSTALPALSDADAAAHRVAVDMWRDKWVDGHVGFHLPRAHHQLVQHKTALLGEGVTSPPEQSKRILVPLCGKAVDMLWLAACGHRVYGVELSRVAAEEFFAESGMPRSVASADRPQGGPAEPWGAGVTRVHTSGNVAVIEGDLFSLRATTVRGPPDTDSTTGERQWDRAGDGDAVDVADTEDGDARVGAQGSISFREESLRFAAGRGPAMDAVWDRGALVAVEPHLRERYALALSEWMAPGARMLVVVVSYDPDAGIEGPPHNVSPDTLKALYEPLGMAVTLLGSEECIDSAPPRMRQRISSMTESVYLVTKPPAARRHRW